MKLVELSTMLQNYCHAGKSLDNIIIEYEGKYLRLDKIDIKKGKYEEDIVIELKKEE